MLAMIAPPLVLLTIVVIAIVLILVVPKLRSSKKVDKLADGLFSNPPKNSTDSLINEIKEDKEHLADKVKQNVKTIKDINKDSEKINKNL